MRSENHGRLQPQDDTLTAAFEAALQRVRDRSSEVILAARLATAVHMGREAESTAARSSVDADFNEVSSQEAAPAVQTGAALLVRRGTRR